MWIRQEEIVGGLHFLSMTEKELKEQLAKPGAFPGDTELAFAILQLRKTEQIISESKSLVSETAKLARITWGLVCATWFLAIATIICPIIFRQ